MSKSIIVLTLSLGMLVLTERRNLMNRTRTVVIGALMLALSFPVVGSAQDRKADPDLVRARQLFFGAENVDPRSGRVRHDKVIFSWFTNSSYAVSLKGPDNPAGLLRPSSGDCTGQNPVRCGRSSESSSRSHLSRAWTLRSRRQRSLCGW